jgi:uncharacterized protein (TIGR00730 family)
MRSIAVFCGSNTGNDTAFIAAAKSLGSEMAGQQIELVFGGGRIGIMGVVADAVLEAGGRVTGVIPSFLHSKEIAHEGLTELITVDSMHDRKRIMQERAEGFIALPGGFGTLEELFEMITWAQLGLHQKPIALFNVAGFYDPLIHFTRSLVEKALLTKANHDMLLVGDEAASLLKQMREYVPAKVPKWIRDEET